jgi:hypothetical protein
MRAMQRTRTPRLPGPLPEPKNINISEIISPYGMVITWGGSLTGGLGIKLLELKVRLISSKECPSTGEREIRTDFYIQAELLISRLEDEGFPCLQSPRIIIDSEGGFLTGMIELHIKVS